MRSVFGRFSAADFGRKKGGTQRPSGHSHKLHDVEESLQRRSGHHRQDAILNGVQHTIIGVAPEKFHGTFIGYSFNFWVPTSMQETFDNTGYKLEDRGARWIEGYAFSQTGRHAATSAGRTFRDRQRLENDFPETNRGHGFEICRSGKRRSTPPAEYVADARHHRGRRFLCSPHRLRQREQSASRAITLAPT